MKRVERILQILIILMISLSGLLLGMSQGDFEPFFIAVAAAVAAWILVDVMKWFSLPQWLANGIAITVTAFTVASFFFTGDPVRQLLGVGKLLVYLQSILLFQKKSARVYWQIMVLSLLQIVVGAVFNLGFEGGVLFIVYMMCAGLTMLMLHLYQQREIIRNQDRAQRRSQQERGSRAKKPVTVLSLPQSADHRHVLGTITRQYLVMGIGILLFGVTLFYFLPRENSSWAGPMEVPMRQTGYLQRVSTSHPELIPMSLSLEMTVQYRRVNDEQPFIPVEMPYLRGMTLPKLVIEDGETTWLAASSQVLATDYRPLVDIRQLRVRCLFQEIVLEPTDDPLLYSPVPACGTGTEADQKMEFCWPLAGITRERSSDKITVTHHRYKLAVPILTDGTFFKAWPYRPRSGNRPLTEAEDTGNWRWFTYLDSARYPTLVQTAGEVADQIGDENHYLLARELENYFERESRFTYAVDFRDISRDSSLDGVEDFFANHRTGHCVYYASALTLMLRSQGIPARVVVGYRGGSVNEFGEHLDVEARHAHAWVEAYIRPEDCPEWMSATRQSGELGAWLRLDATPAIDFDSLLTSNALNYAKSFWRDYVLGLQSDTGSTVVDANGIKLSGFLKFLDLEWWQSNAATTAAKIREPGTWQNWLLMATPLFVLAGVAIWFYLYRRRRSGSARNATSRGKRESNRNSIRQRMARLASGMSPRLANWLAPAGDRPPVVPFYERFTRLLDKFGWMREPGQTHREFARQVGQSGPAPGNSELAALTMRITDFYYLVRFGARPLDDSQQADVRQALNQLETLLTANQPSLAPTASEIDR